MKEKSSSLGCFSHASPLCFFNGRTAAASLFIICVYFLAGRGAVANVAVSEHALGVPNIVVQVHIEPTGFMFVMCVPQLCFKCAYICVRVFLNLLDYHICL